MNAAHTHSHDGTPSAIRQCHEAQLAADQRLFISPSLLDRLIFPKETKRVTDYAAAVSANPVIQGIKKEFDSKGLDSEIEFHYQGSAPHTARLKIEWVQDGHARRDYIDFHNDGKVVWHDFTLKAQPVYPVPFASGDPAVQLANDIAIEKIADRASQYIPEALSVARLNMLRKTLGPASQETGFLEALTV